MGEGEFMICFDFFSRSEKYWSTLLILSGFTILARDVLFSPEKIGFLFTCLKRKKPKEIEKTDKTKNAQTTIFQ